MLYFNDRTSPKKSLPGLVDATAEGLVIHAQRVRFFDDAYDIAETAVPITWPGEPARIRVVLTSQGLVLDVQRLAESPTPVPGEIVYLAALTLRSETDTPESVEVEVPRVTLVEDPAMSLPAPAVYAVPPGFIVPVETPERAQARAQRARERALAATVRGAGGVGRMAPSERDALLELVVSRLGIDLGEG